MWAKLRTVAVSNNRDHARNLSYYCLLAPHICMVLFFTLIPFVVNHTINATPPERLQQYNRCLHMTNLERRKTLWQHLLLFVCLVCIYCTQIFFFLLHKSNTGETQTPKQCTNNYCNWSPSYRNVE